MRELIEKNPVKDSYEASNRNELLKNMKSLAELYDVCDEIADNVDKMSGTEYSDIAELADSYLRSVEKAYESLNVGDFPSVSQNTTYKNLVSRRESVNTKIALEPPKIVSVDSIYPDADFRVEMHSLYSAGSDREYALNLKNLSEGKDVSTTYGYIPEDSYSDEIMLRADNCKANNKVEIDVIYNGVNCADTNGCSFTGTVMEPNASSDWAAGEIEAAIKFGLVPEELQKNYTSRISRRGFCLLAAKTVEVATGEDIQSYSAAHRVESFTFTDTKETEIMCSAQLGIVYGYEDGTFLPNNDITREQSAAMLTRCARLLGMSDKAPDGAFADDAQISGWAKESVMFVRANGIMAGDTDNNFMPQSGYTVEQAIATFYRMYNKL